jgi:hypothetical protein
MDYTELSFLCRQIVAEGIYIRVFAKKPSHFRRSTGAASRRRRSKRQSYGLMEEEILPVVSCQEAGPTSISW